jgi:hypothetical protein
MGSQETLLSRLEVHENEGLVAGFRGLGTIYFPDWLNTFCVKFGRRWELKTKKRLEEFKKNLKESDTKELIDTIQDSSSSRVVSKDWLIYQLDLPIKSRGLIPTTTITPQYTKIARFKLKSPWHFISLPEELKYGLEVKRELEKEVILARQTLAENSSPSLTSRIMNILFQETSRYNGKNLDEIQSSMTSRTKGRVPQGVFDRMIETQQIKGVTNSKIRDFGEIVLRKEGNNFTGFQVSARDWNFLQQGRMITLEELLSNSILFLDIEVPLFRKKDYTISWIGSSLIQRGFPDYRIDTIHDLNTGRMEDFSIISHLDEDSQIDSFRKRIAQEKPLVCAAHNARFDLVKLRESNTGFKIPDEDGKEKPPRYKVTTPSLERLGISDMVVLDTMRWQKIARKYDCNAKLTMMVGEEKSLSYSEMEQMEQGTTEDKKRIATYLTGDIRGPVEKVLLSGDFRNNLEDVLFIAGWSNVSPERLLHSTRCINECQERLYFRELGIFREEIPPNLRTTQFQKERDKAKDAFRRLVVNKGIKRKDFSEGLFKEVYKAYIPVGDMFRDLVICRFPQAEEFYNYRDSHKNDKQRLFFLDQYSESLAEWMIEYYGSFLIWAEKFNSSKGNLKTKEVSEAYHYFKSIAQEKRKKAFNFLQGGNLTVPELRKILDSTPLHFQKQEAIQDSELVKIFNTYSRMRRAERRIIGNFGVFPSQTSLGRAGYLPEKYQIINEVLRSRFGEINNFISGNSLEVVAQEGEFLYLSGKEEPLRGLDCPITLVDKIANLFVSDNPYYKKNGFYSHLKITGEPTAHLTSFEMENFGLMLDSLVSGDFSRAIGVYTLARDKLSYSGKIPGEKFLFHIKSRDRYSVFSKDFRGRLYFVESEDSVPQDSEVLEENGRKYFIESEQRTWILPKEQVLERLDTSVYLDRFIKRGRAILKPVLRGKKEKFEEGQMLLNLN